MDPEHPSLTYICEVHPHHAAHHALYRMVSEMGAVRIGRKRRYGPRSVFSLRCDRWIFRLSGNSTYTVHNLLDECRAGLSILSRPGSVVHVIYGDDGFRYLGVMNGVRGARIIASLHQPPAVFDRRVAWKTYLRRLSAAHVVARVQIPFLSNYIPEERIFFIPHPVDADFFCPDPSVAKTGRRCIFAGQWLRDFGLLEETVRRVHAADPSVHFTLVTFPERFPPFEGMPNVELRSGISDEELRALYRRADLLLLPLEECTFNNSMLEGMACGLPVVTNDIGGVRDYADPSCAVLLKRGCGGGEMAGAVLALLGDARARGEMAVRARERALAVHWERIMPDYLRMYRTVAGA
ncbi:MAG: glycosyltransferase family 4 protein [Candidatus Aureabacteria bacterium]|nr:glycosyltransferase family 4 protein [Candidatus Auribacterota bacterium]